MPKLLESQGAVLASRGASSVDRQSLVCVSFQASMHVFQSVRIQNASSLIHTSDVFMHTKQVSKVVINTDKTCLLQSPGIFLSSAK